MNAETLRKLKDNPHYKLSRKQESELAQYDRKPMVEFGFPKLHNSDFKKHNTTPKKKKRISIDDSEKQV